MPYVLEDNGTTNENKKKEIKMTERLHESSKKLSRTASSRSRDSYEYIDLVSCLIITEVEITIKCF